MTEYTVGIDLGTTNSCVAVFRNNQVEIIENELGYRVTPSWVSFTNDLVLTGNAAVEESHLYLKNTVFEAKRLIGQKFSDPRVQEDVKRLPYKIFDDLGSPKIRIGLVRGVEEEYHHKEISAPNLKKMKTVAEEQLNATVRRAIITVPAYFNDAQKQAAKDTGAIAGFEVVDVLTEPDPRSQKIKIELQNIVEKEYYPEEISAFILKKMKTIAEARLNATVRRAVITVPAYFNDAQRQATKDAGEIAGFKVVNVINEPTAAALAFHHLNKTDDKRNIMVYDFGGGTFDVSIVSVGKGGCRVKSTKGDSHLGGVDIDTNLVNYIKDDFRAQHGKDIINSHLANRSNKQLSKEITIDMINRRLNTGCERAKKALSTKFQATIELDNLSQEKGYFNLTRIRLEQSNEELFQRTLQIVDECLNESGLKKEDINEVVLVGGSSRIPKIQKMLENYFGKEKLNKGINPDEAVAYGAAIHATNLAGDKSDVMDITSLSLGTNIYGDLMSFIIPRNTPVPAKAIKRYQTITDNQPSMEFPIYQGEKEIASENFELGNFTMTNLTEAPAKSVKVEVCFQIDAEGLLKVSAIEINGNNNNRTEIQIDVKRKGLTEEQIRQRTIEAEQNREKEVKRRRFEEKKHNLEVTLYEAKTHSEKCNDKVRATILDKYEEIRRWLEKAKLDDLDELENKRKEVKDLIDKNPPAKK